MDMETTQNAVIISASKSDIEAAITSKVISNTAKLMPLIGSDKKFLQICGLNKTVEIANQSKSKHFVQNINSKAQFRLIKPLDPPPKIPIQFQAAPKISVATQISHQTFREHRKAVENDTNPICSVRVAAPSATDLLTINHANRSLVYREPVSTKDTAPTKNSNNPSNFIPLVPELSRIYSQKPSTIQQTATTTDKIRVTFGTDTVLGPAITNWDTQKHTEHSTKFILTNEQKELLVKKHSIANKTLGQTHLHGICTQLQQGSGILKKVSTPLSSFLPDEKQLPKMNEICSTSVALKRNRTKSAYTSEYQQQQMLAKMSRTKSNESPEVINLDDLPEKNEPLEKRTYRTATQHDVLYHKLRADAEEVLKKRKLETNMVPIVGSGGGVGCSNIRIQNGQLTDMNGPIRLVDKPVSVMHIARKNAAIASLPREDRARKLKEEIETNESVLNLLENGDEKQIKRTYSRSKSFSTAGLRFKLNLNNPTKVKKQVYKPTKSIDHDQDWQSLTETLSKPIGKTVSNETTSSSNNSENDGMSQCPSEIEQVLTWNTSKTLGQLPKSHVIFQRNEFGMTEMDVLAMTKLKAIKQHKNDYKHFPQVEPSMACGHSDSAACFDAIVQRLLNTTSTNGCKVNDKRPHQYYSTEFKQIIGALVQNKNNNCQAITNDDVKAALGETNMYDRTKNSSHFSWNRFIDYYNQKHPNDEPIQLAPTELFTNKFPRTPNTFEIGQKLEAIDPQNSSLFCVCTIVDKCGYRIKLRFDGYPSTYDFWVNADSTNIFPAGWCAKTGRKLEVHRRCISNRNASFDWGEYLRQTNTQAAHQACFPNINTARTQMNPFKIGMKLEADDIKKTERICVATIGDVIGNRVLVTLDELDSCYDYWTDITSPYIHPINFHQEGSFSISSPPSWRVTPFSWEGYLRQNRAEAVSKDAFYTREPKAFTKNMALEVVDKKNPSLIRPAIITNIQDYHIKVLFIGWPEKYAYWIDDDSRDIYPAGYCKKTGHPIECPLDDIYSLPKSTCGTLGCRGIGNGKRPEVSTHSTLDECPYEESNWMAIDSDIRSNRIDRRYKSVNRAFNIGAGPSRKISVNPAFEKVQVSLQPILNPTELAAMSSKEVEIFRRLQVSANFLLGNRKALAEIREQWIDRLTPLRSVQVLASAKNPLLWTTDEVAEFVSQLPNCSGVGETFIANDIDGLAFLSLRTDDMIDIMGLDFGTAIKVFNRIMLLREECNAHYIRYE